MKLRSLLMVAVTLLDIGFLWAQTPHAHFDTVIRNEFFAGLQGDARAMALAMAACDRLLADDPTAAEPMVWHGSGLMYSSGAAFGRGDINTGMTLYARSLDEMASAVKLQPNSPGVLIPRGATLLGATLKMEGNPQRDTLLRLALGDYLKVLELQQDRFASLGTHPRGQLLLGIADAYARLGQTADARTYFERIVHELPDTEYAVRAQHGLDNGKLTVSEETCTGCHISQ